MVSTQIGRSWTGTGDTGLGYSGTLPRARGMLARGIENVFTDLHRANCTACVLGNKDKSTYEYRPNHQKLNVRLVAGPDQESRLVVVNGTTLNDTLVNRVTRQTGGRARITSHSARLQYV